MRVYIVRGRVDKPSNLHLPKLLTSLIQDGDNLVTFARNWKDSASVWITIGHTSVPCLKRRIVLLAESLSSDQATNHAKELAALNLSITVCTIEPLDSDNKKKELYVRNETLAITPWRKIDMIRMENVELMQAMYYRQHDEREVLWCRHCLSLANEASVLEAWRKLVETDCSANGYEQMCRRRSTVMKHKSGLALGCSSLKRAMRTAMVLGGGTARHSGKDPDCRPGGQKEDTCCDLFSVPITIYPELKEHQNRTEKVLKGVMYTQSTTDKANIAKQLDELNRRYGGVRLQPVEWTTKLEAIAKTNEPDFTYFVENRLFAGPAKQLIVSHGHFLAQYVLSRFSALRT